MLLNKILWLLWLTGVTLLHLFGNNLGTRVIFISSAVIPAVCIVLTLCGRNTVRAEILLNDEYKKHSDITGILKITGSRYSSSFEIACINLLTGEKTVNKYSIDYDQTIKFTINSNHCGKLKITAGNFIIYDPFKLIKHRIDLHEEKDIIIYPETFRTQISLIDDISPILDSDIYSTSQSGNDPGETFAVREYTAGDSVNSIHWKLSQKSEQLMVREFGFPIINHVLVLFENALLNTEVSPDNIDAMAEIFISVSSRLIEQDINHTVGWKHNDTDSFISYEMNSREDMYIFGDFLSNAVKSSENTVIDNINEIGLYSHIAVINSYTEPDICMLYNGNRVTMITCGNDESVNNIHKIPFTTESYKTDLSILEL